MPSRITVNEFLFGVSEVTMRKSLVFAMVAVLVCSSLTLAGVPDPSRSDCGMNNPSNNVACHPPFGSGIGMYRFTAQNTGGAGQGDLLTCKVTLRDAFDTPVASCSTSASLSSSTIGQKEFPAAPPKSYCACSTQAPGNKIKGMTNASGIVNLVISKLGGHGTLDIAITAHCVGNIAICTKSVEYSSPDMLGTCELHPTASTTIGDIGAWAVGLGTYTRFSDYTCGGGVSVGDLGFIGANGLNKGCN
jgi:hypothetical protein